MTYIKKCAVYKVKHSSETSHEGLPMMVHLYLSNPKDRNCRSIEDEWMFGAAFLVAPYYRKESRQR
ncbi:MAG: glycoside hydrolase family 31 protein [bacterium]|nr:glycoside hydrolase family 31 protein [bacterium]